MKLNIKNLSISELEELHLAAAKQIQTKQATHLVAANLNEASVEQLEALVKETKRLTYNKHRETIKQNSLDSGINQRVNIVYLLLTHNLTIEDFVKPLGLASPHDIALLLADENQERLMMLRMSIVRLIEGVYKLPEDYINQSHQNNIDTVQLNKEFQETLLKQARILVYTNSKSYDPPANISHEIYENRRNNLLYLIEMKRYSSVWPKTAKQALVEMNIDFINHLKLSEILIGRLALGSELAREIEKKLKLEDEYLDHHYEYKAKIISEIKTTSSVKRKLNASVEINAEVLKPKQATTTANPIDKTVYVNRKQNLKKLLKNNQITAYQLGVILGLQEISHVHRLLENSRPTLIAEASARLIEFKMNIPFGTLDQESLNL